MLRAKDRSARDKAAAQAFGGREIGWRRTAGLLHGRASVEYQLPRLEDVRDGRGRLATAARRILTLGCAHFSWGVLPGVCVNQLGCAGLDLGCAHLSWGVLRSGSSTIMRSVVDWSFFSWGVLQK
jgi:hypothetical protein